MAEQVKANFNIFINSEATIKNQSSQLNYLFRYNIVSENGDVVSPWSNIIELNQEDIQNLLNGFTPTYSSSSIESGGTAMKINWSVPDSFTPPKLDVYLSWAYDTNPIAYLPYTFAGSVTSNSYYVEIPFNYLNQKAKFLKVAVQLPTTKKIINTNALLFETPGISTAPVLDGGTIV